MNKLFFMEPIIKSLSKKNLLQEIFSGILKGLAILIALTTLWTFFKGFDVFHYLDFGQKIIYFFFFNMLALITGFIICQILWIRSEDIRQERNEEYKAIPIFKYMIKAFGEIYGVCVIIAGFSSMIFVWLKIGRGLYAELIPNLGLVSSDTFLSGLLLFLSAIIISGFVIFITYYLAELTSVLVDIAKNIRELNKKST
ncbi:MAG: hypothetical protein MUO31_09965 [Thermodesulfovibrionales bacterium]|nr:hypothetical protein [Thermodesulfovibrionales bacterium]